MVLQTEFALKVKNTFIDVDDKNVEFDLEDQDWLKMSAGRQVSEPIPQSTFLRQMSAGIAKPTKPAQLVSFNEVVQEESIGSDTPPLRQHSDIDQETSAWGRMVTAERQDSFTSPSPAPAAVMVPGYFEMQTAPMDAMAYPNFVSASHVMAMQGAEMDMAMSRAGYVMGFQATPYPEEEMAEGTMIAVCHANAMNLPQPPSEWEHTYTVMMRNLPNKYTQQMLLEEINNAGFRNAFDFLYLPVDPETNANKGYAFINFVEPSLAWMFKNTYEGRKMERFNSHKYVSVMPAALQGFEANHAHYSGARVSRGDPNTRPLFLREPKLQTMSNQSGLGSAERRRRRGGRVSLIDQAAQRAEVAKRHGGGVKTPRGTGGSSTASTASSDTPPKRTGVGPSIKFCPYCGGNVQTGFQFCQFCGSSLPHA